MRLLVVLILFSLSASARDLDFKSAGFGTYFRGEYGLAQRGDASFADSSGTGVSFSGTRTTNAGGEFGLLWTSEKTVFRIATQVLFPKHLSLTGSSSDGTPYYDLDSKVTAFIPEAFLDFVVLPMGDSRVMVSIGGGDAFVTSVNQYTMTTAGTAAFAGISDHTVTGKGSGLMLSVSTAYELEFADRATLVVDLGYRYCRVNQLTSSGDVTTFTGTYRSGDTLKNNNGSDMSLDLGGFFGGAGFRFYF